MRKHDFKDKRWVRDFYGAAVSWWGESWYDGENLKDRAEIIKRYVPAGADILELGAGTGETAQYLASKGYKITAVDITPQNIDLIRQIAETLPSVTLVLGDFLDVEIAHRYDVVVLFETFGIGSDSEQRTLLERIDGEWLKTGGFLIMDVYHPFGPMRDAGKNRELDALEDVETSVAMREYSDFDLLNCRWIDTWEPIANPEKALSQSIRCYSPADLSLLASGLGLELIDIFIDGKKLKMKSTSDFTVNYDSSFLEDYSYRVVFRK